MSRLIIQIQVQSVIPGSCRVDSSFGGLNFWNESGQLIVILKLELQRLRLRQSRSFRKSSEKQKTHQNFQIQGCFRWVAKVPIVYHQAEMQKNKKSCPSTNQFLPKLDMFSIRETISIPTPETFSSLSITIDPSQWRVFGPGWHCENCTGCLPPWC